MNGEKYPLKQLLLLLIVKSEGPIGRYRLVDMLNLPEGVVRGLISNLLKDKNISPSKLGCQLTAKGEAFLKKLLARYDIAEIREFEAEPLKIAEKTIAVQVKKKAQLIVSAMEQRDIAVRAGAHGAILLIYQDGVLRIPTAYSNLAAEHPKLAEQITHSFKLDNGDLIIISGAENKWRALEGSLAIALALKE
jgi:predicted transcriptional regulator